MKFGVNFSASVRQRMAEEHEKGEKAVTSVMRGAGTRLKNAWRDQITGAGLGRRLAFTIRSESYPKGTASMNAAAMIWSKAPHIVSAHEEGATIFSKDGFWLAIPTEAAGKAGRGRGRLTPGEWEKRNNLRLRFVYRPGKASLLVLDSGRVSKRGLAKRKGGRRRKKDGILTGEQTVPIFILVPQVRLKKRLDLMRDAQQVAGTLPRAIEVAWKD